MFTNPANGVFLRKGNQEKSGLGGGCGLLKQWDHGRFVYLHRGALLGFDNGDIRLIPPNAAFLCWYLLPIEYVSSAKEEADTKGQRTAIAR